MSNAARTRSRELAEGRGGLLFFAVKEEAKFFRASGLFKVVVTGIGQRNAELSANASLARDRPALVLTCGFAGGLNPAFRVGDVLFSADEECPIIERLVDAGARLAHFHCAKQVAITAAEKSELWHATGADAVEMESGVIRRLSQVQHIPSATVRVISDSANEDLPLDFNRLMTPDLQISGRRLAQVIAQSPQVLPRLLKFRKQTVAAARRLAEVLHTVCTNDPTPF